MRTTLRMVAVAGFVFQQSAILACTAFLAYDRRLALGGNNEDWEDPDTYLWFNPAEKDMYGRVAFGYGNLWPQGGMNDQGLFFDGMTTDPLPLKKTEGKQPCPHDLLDRMMRECDNVDEAVKFLDRFHMPRMANAMLFLGDKRGTSAIYEGDDVLRGDGSHQVVTNYYQSRQSMRAFREPDYRSQTSPRFLRSWENTTRLLHRESRAVTGSGKV